ncbi:MAG: hypothetical protein AABZ31_01615 [Bdellovibrionota bacterium]
MTNETSNSDAAEATSTTKSNTSLIHNWRDRFEELLKVKNVDDLKGELTRLGQDLQDEIKQFDLQEYLSPTAKDRLKNLETRYADVMKAVQKAQKQFDREFSKSLRTLKKTRQDAEKRLSSIRSQVEVQRKKVLKASDKLRSKIVKKTKVKAKTVRKKASK